MLNQYQQRQQFGQIMPEPPNVISTKDHLYLKDALSWELASMKMMHHASLNCKDPEIKDFLNRVGRMHQVHYQILLRHTDPYNVDNQ
ncbi:hypothetical protein [Desulfotruncus alcoholivorax]|uniref:hypothetical protein n=1 Tax=Desulfotruncus alcoholivorax TaxID=265477 RepID=UPI0003F4EEB7|nr:hypothetical protein [Desulfotruncus alcoholivorax]